MEAEDREPLRVADVLALPTVRAAAPTVVAGHAGLRRPVRWVHSAELADIAPLLRGGDLLLSTGIALPDTAAGLRDFAASLAGSDAAGLVIELGRRWTALPDALVRGCDDVGLPLVALGRVARFAALAQVVGERIVDQQLDALRAAQRVHETFTELSIAEAGPREILEATQRLAGAAVVLEGEDHRVVDYRSGPADVGAFLAGWTERSRAVRLEGRTTWDGDQGWLLTRIGKHGRAWGRLVVEAPIEPSERLVAVAERAAAALALHRLHDRHRDGVARRTHHELVLGLLADPTDADVRRRCDVAGVPLEHRQLVGLTVRALGGGGDEVAAALVRAVHVAAVPALVCEIDRQVRVLLSLPRTADPVRVVDELVATVHRRHAVVAGAGRPAPVVDEVDRTLRESAQVVASVRDPDDGPAVRRLEDVHLRGLLALLGDDERVALFVDRELGALRAHDRERGTELERAVRALVEHPTSKSDAAASLHVSRPVLYDRLARAERVIGARLDDPDIRTSLHAALLADDLARDTR